ncbi:class I SAM-dependent methyltransferase [Candidatus Marithioploca araucensis]|uniref:Class I SAM-dependent methyltransferase n=1 Tax=Candidatus Marithioploca araucensis TaxID=70273 RepID=A0ABT7VQJ7_9GAMM|nr:class I SAM-dependent methyltransferase [Candidatus Marithioploca araucensis]
MSQITQGIRSILSVPAIYSLFGQLLDKKKGGGNTALVKEYIRPKANDQLLDIGCGTGNILDYLPENVEYTGFDANHQYIEAAQKRYGHRATFICERINTAHLGKYSQFDLVFVDGVLHHLDDREALQLFKIAYAALKNGGRLITMDGVFVENQSSVARWLISKDRGQNVRTQEGYLELASQVFSNINTDIRHDLLRIPYTHFILECSKQ